MGSLGALIGCPRGLPVPPGTEPLDHGCLFKFKIVAMERRGTWFPHRGGGARPLPGGTQTRDTAVRAEGGRRLPAPRTPFPVRPALTAAYVTADQNPQSPGRCFPTNTFTGRGD